MKTTKYPRRFITLGIAALPILSMSAPNSEHTPGIAAPSGITPSVAAPYTAPPEVFVPQSSKAIPKDAGVRMHTNHMIYNPQKIQPNSLSDLKQATPEANTGKAKIHGKMGKGIYEKP